MCLENCAPLEQPVIKEELLTCIRLSPPLRATACGARPFPSSRRGATCRSDHRSLVRLRIPLRADMTFGKAGVSTWCTSPCARLFVLESTFCNTIAPTVDTPCCPTCRKSADWLQKSSGDQGARRSTQLLKPQCTRRSSAGGRNEASKMSSALGLALKVWTRPI
jgi:hypothetical protein